MARFRPEWIFHLAGGARGKSYEELFRDNVQCTENLLEGVLSKSSGCRVIVPGSAAEYGRVGPESQPVLENQTLHPISPYGVSKAWQTLLCGAFADRGVDIVIGRIFNVIGREAPVYSAIGSFLAQIENVRMGLQPPVLKTGNLHSKRDYLDVRDVAEALLALAEKGSSGEAYNVCSGGSVSMKEVLCRMIDRSGCRIQVEEDSQHDSGRSRAIWDSLGSNAKLRRETGWTPKIALEQSISDLF